MNRRRLLALAAALALVFQLCGGAALAGDTPQDHADRLYALGLFRGTGTSPDGSPVYSLERTPTRLQGLIMLIRLLGLEQEALAYTGPNPFTDVSGTYAPLAAFARARGITKGVTDTTFLPGGNLSGRNYVTFLLRAMGYREGDFPAGRQMDYAVSLSLLTEDAARELESKPLTRGELVSLSYAALTRKVKESGETLAEKLCREGVFTRSAGMAAGVLGEDAGWTYGQKSADTSTVEYEKKSVATSTGVVTAHVLTVNTANPAVTVKSALVDGTLGHTAPFSRIIQSSGGCLAAVNANFFASYDDFKAPIGHVMVNGRFLYASSGLTAIGITRDGEIRVGRPAVFTRLTSGANHWAIYEINTAGQEPDTSVLYTPAYGASVVFREGGWAMVVNNGAITEYYYASPGASITIPAGGYVAYMGRSYATADYFRLPQVGGSVSMEYYLRTEDPEGFSLEDMESIISGAPRLVKDGKIVTALESGFDDAARFGPDAASPRTAAGVRKDGKLVLVSVPGGASLRQLREIMVKLECEDAVNLDGGASCGMYYNGSYIATPGRELAATLQVFVK